MTISRCRGVARFVNELCINKIKVTYLCQFSALPCLATSLLSFNFSPLNLKVAAAVLDVIVTHKSTPKQVGQFLPLPLCICFHQERKPFPEDSGQTYLLAPLTRIKLHAYAFLWGRLGKQNWPIPHPLLEDKR